MSPIDVQDPTLEFEPVPEDAKPHPWAMATCKVWGALCATLLAVAVVLEVRRFVFSPAPVSTREAVAWLCLDALFLLGAYAAFDLMCVGRRDNRQHD